MANPQNSAALPRNTDAGQQTNSMTMIAPIAAWLLPGLGHLIQRRNARIDQRRHLLLDIWAKAKEPENSVYYDITWTGSVGTPSDKQREVFDIVRGARDVGIHTVKQAFDAKRKICGWEVDKAVREFIDAKGWGKYFIHRTGHSITNDIHGNGANLDNLETKDDREILPNTCFSVEPGIYLPEFGVRSEVNMMVRGGKGEVTGRIQTELVQI